MLKIILFSQLLEFIDQSCIYVLPNTLLVFSNATSWGVQLQDFFSLSLCFYVGGMFVMCINKKNIIIFTLGVEVMFLGAALAFILFSIALGSPEGQIYALFLLTLAAAESAIVLGLLVAQFNLKGSISFFSIGSLR